jgi:integrase
VDFDARTIYVRAEEVGASKSGHARLVPIVDRLVEELDTLRRRGTPAGDAWPRTAYVFGDAIGGQVRNVKKAWLTAVLVAHGKTPAWSRGALAQASLNDLDVIDLNFHDLRHEAASRWNDSGVVGLAQIQELLGHKAATTTAGYLHGAGAVATRAALQHYDAHRRQAAVVAVAATAGVSGPQKLHKNGNGTGGSASGPRLVRSRKS